MNQKIYLKQTEQNIESSRMNKLLVTLIATIIFIPYIECMETNPQKSLSNKLQEKYPILVKLDKKYKEARETNTLAEMALSIVAKKTYSYLTQSQNEFAQEITSKFSQLDKDLYKKMGNVYAARSILIYFAKDYNNFSVRIAKKFTFSGAKKCLALSNSLYNKDATPDTIKVLFKNGAILNYLSSQENHRQYPVLYWSQIDQENPTVSKTIVKELLDLGADTEVCGLLDYVVDTDLDLTQLVLEYKPKINTQVWASALLSKNQEKILPLLIEHATQDELNAGLTACFKLWFNDKDTNYKPETMQLLINSGANPSVGILALMSVLPNLTCPVNSDDLFVKNLIFLCKNKAYDQKALSQLRDIHNLFGCMVEAIEKNQPSNPFWLEL